jgi:ABC-type uncharacterized transport system permease subunit
MAQFTELQVRTALEKANGAIVNAKGDNEANLLISQGHGKCFNPTFNKRMFYSHAPATSMSAPATAAIGNIVWNPPESGIIAALHKWSVCNLVTDADTVQFDLGYSAQATLPTTVTASTTGCCYLGAVGSSTSICKAYSVATISVAATPIWLLAHNTAAINTVGEDQLTGDFEGSIIVPPGYLVHIMIKGTAAGSSGVTSSLMWEEISI